jgi:hypothetical protein
MGVLLKKIDPSVFMTALVSHAVSQPHLRPPQTRPELQVFPAQQFCPAPPQLQVPFTHWRPVPQVVPLQQA